MEKAIICFLARVRMAVAAFRYGRDGWPFYAVIYDSYEGLNPTKDDPREEFYEMFESPEEALRVFSNAYPDKAMTKNPRLVLILGDLRKIRRDHSE